MENSINLNSPQGTVFVLYDAINKTGDVTNTITIKHDGMFELYVTCNWITSHSLTLNGVSQSTTSFTTLGGYDRYVIEWTLFVHKGDVITWSFVRSAATEGIAFGVSTGLKKLGSTANASSTSTQSVSKSVTNGYLLGYASAVDGSSNCSTTGGSPTVISSTGWLSVTLLDCTDANGTLTASASASSTPIWLSSAVFQF